MERVKSLTGTQATAPATTPVAVTGENFGRVPRVYIETLRDRTITPSAQREMYERTPCREVISLDTSHFPQYAAPEELAGRLISLSARDGNVSQPLVYVDTSAVREGALDTLKDAIEELVEFLAANEPRLLLYEVCLSDDGTEMTVVHVHADSDSLEYHMEVGGPIFRRFAELVALSSIRVYGEPSEKAVGQLHGKGRMLGCEDVAVQGRYAGFSRLTTYSEVVQPRSDQAK